MEDQKLLEFLTLLVADGGGGGVSSHDDHANAQPAFYKILILRPPNFVTFRTK